MCSVDHITFCSDYLCRAAFRPEDFNETCMFESFEACRLRIPAFPSSLRRLAGKVTIAFPVNAVR
jgi:hypothetical protein